MKADHRSLHAAAQWYATLLADDASDEDRHRWRIWLEQDPNHQRAWSEIETVSQCFRPLQQEAMQRQAASNALQNVHRMDHASHMRRKTMRSLLWLASGGLAGWLGWQHASVRRSLMARLADHNTAIGEIREQTLEDGSRIWLDTNSALDVAYSENLRLLTLHNGAIMVETAADPKRPFILETRDGKMQALGTRFGTRLLDNETSLSVYAGAVRIRTGTTQIRTTLQAGEQTHFDRQLIHPVTPLSGDAPAWTTGVLVAHDIALGQLAAELERYRRGRINVAPEVAGLHVLGAYPLSDTDLALQLLENALPIRVKRPLPWWISIDPA